MTSPRSPTFSTSFRRIACAMPLAVRDVGQEPQLTRALYRRRELGLMPPAVSGDAGGADLALLAHRPPQRAEVLVVDEVDLVAAERARLEPAASAWALPVTPAPLCRGPATLLRHAKKLPTSLSQNGMSSSEAPPPPPPTGADWKSPVSAGTSDCGVKRPLPPFPPSSRDPRN